MSWKSLAASALVLMIAAAAWLLVRGEERADEVLFSLPHHIADVSLSATLSYHETQLEGDTVDFSRTLAGVARLHPSPSPFGTRYRLEWLSAEWSEAEDLLIAFERDEESIAYRTSPTLSERERHRLFEQFQIDLTHNDANNDQSLFQLPTSFTVDTAGRIRDLQLASPLRRLIHTAIRGLQGRHSLQELLETSATPSLWIWERVGPSTLKGTYIDKQKRDLLGQPEGYQVTLSVDLSPCFTQPAPSLY